MLTEPVHEVHLKIALEKELVTVIRKRLPYETCGVIYGTKERGIIAADGFSLVRNASASPANTFSFHPEDWVSVYLQAQKNQREIVGLFHSHPQGSTAPSLLDETGSVPWGTYWIVSIASDNHEIAAYRRDSQDNWICLPITRVS
ncbi:Mov34/MPN/PAD-1 family protein [Cohnella luojiensis]|uniref:Mov34/MPN/PAD-1 family protein n=1 Tax=Cohnella luojiensis TaxID=652876 RepID=UPI00142FC088|nr:M67 family metallopeptidase [Cohnella luojiensis]